MVTELTPAQSRVLDFIRSHMASNGYPPTQAEIANTMNYRSPNAVRDHLFAIQRKGFIELMPHTARGIRLTSMPTEQLSMLEVMANPNIPARPVLSLKSRSGRIRSTSK
jgi:SOS-response transcriptional repressor LexA